MYKSEKNQPPRPLCGHVHATSHMSRRGAVSEGPSLTPETKLIVNQSSTGSGSTSHGRSGTTSHPPFAMPQPTATLIDDDLIRNCHQILICHLPGNGPTLQHAQGSLITLNIGEVTVELRQDQEDNTRLREQAENKGLPKFLGKKLTYLLRLA